MHPVTLKRRQRRQNLIKLLGGKCAHCGSEDSLEFDHLNPSQKEFRVAEMLDWGEVRLNEEVDKCQLLCKPCHHKKTIDNREYGEEAPHGGMWRWRKYKCRCSKCLAAKDKYNEYRRSLYQVKDIKASIENLLQMIRK